MNTDYWNYLEKMKRMVPEMPTLENMKTMVPEMPALPNVKIKVPTMSSLSKIENVLPANPTLRRAGIIGGGAVVAVGIGTMVLPAVGFTAGGVGAGTAAAAAQSMIGNVAAGSFFAGCQSAGVLGLPVAVKGGLAIAGGTAAHYFGNGPNRDGPVSKL